MGWFRKVFRGSKHKISERKYDRRHGSDTEDNYHSNLQDSQYQNEDIERSIASAVSEEGDSNYLLEKDEQLARALQETFETEYDNTVISSSSAPGSGGNGNGNISLSLSSSSLSILNGYRTEINHVPLRCHECNQLISDSEFSMSGSSPYHKACYQEHFYPKCEVCNHTLPRYLLHPYWKQKSCPSHWSDGTPRCFSCDRLTESAEGKYVGFGDGRKLCLECMETAIMDKNECQPVQLDVLEFFQGLDMKIEQEFPTILVDLKAMNEAMYGEEYEHTNEYEIIRGLCLSEEQTVNQIQRRPKIGAGNQVIEVTTEPYKLTSNFDVTAILILYGLPRLLTGSILAHEMMHAWLRLNGYGSPAEDVVEGICQVLAHMWLEYQIIFMSDSSQNPTFEKKLGEFYKYQIETHNLPAYGEGFRLGKKAVVKHGLQRTLEHIWMTGNFPS